MNELNGTVYMGGGFGGATRATMSDSLAARCAVADAQYAAESAHEQRVKAELAAVDETGASITASILQAQDRGELVDMQQALRDGGVGRTRQEAIAWMSAQADLGDARMAGLARRVERRLNEQCYGDMTAPSPAEVAEEQARADRRARWGAKRQARNEAFAVARTAARLSAPLTAAERARARS